MRSVRYEEGFLIIKFSDRNRQKFFELKDFVKNNLIGCEFLPSKKYWKASALVENYKKLINHPDFGMKHIDDSILFFINNKLKKEKKKINIDESKLKGFREYQKEGVRFLESIKGKGLIADEPGLGKTIQAAGYLILHPELRPALIVCPSTLKLNWQKEIKKWVEEDSYICMGRKPPTILEEPKIYIINYDILGRGEIKNHKSKKGISLEKKINKLERIIEKNKGKEDKLQKIIRILNSLEDEIRNNIKDYKIKQKKVLLEEGWRIYFKNKLKLIIADEVHRVAEPTSFMTKSFIDICKQIEYRVFLSGTPIRDKTKDFFISLNLLNNKLFPNRWGFLRRYCDPKHNGFGWSYNGISNEDELRNLIQNVMIRRLKEDVLKELPPKQKIIIPLYCSNLKEYNNFKSEFLAIKPSLNKIQIRNKIDELKKLAYKAKKKEAFKWIEDFLSSGNKLLVCTYFRETMKELREKFPNHVYIEGGVSIKNRNKAVEEFQNGKTPLFIGQIKAAGEGLTLTAASAVFFMEFGWNSAQHEQFEDRIHRIGQKSDSILCYYPIAEGTDDLKIVQIIQKKNKSQKYLLDGKEDSEFLDSDILDDLLEEL